MFITDEKFYLGGTLIECKNVLLKEGVSKVSAFCTHAVFPLESWKKFTEEKPDQFANFYTTDSCPEMASILKDKKPFKVLPLARNIIDNILKY